MTLYFSQGEFFQFFAQSLVSKAQGLQFYVNDSIVLVH